jgi:hypothetical protein
MPEVFIATLIKSCPDLESFSDHLFYGLSVKSIRSLAIGLPKLKSLVLETSNLPMMHVLRIIPLFTKLEHLQFTNFSNGPLQNNIKELRLALLKLQNLKSLTIDVTTTPHKDGLDAQDWKLLLQGKDGFSPQIQEVCYLADFQSYFDEAPAPKTAKYVWKNQISNIPLVSMQTEEEKKYVSKIRSVALLFRDELKIKRWTIVTNF